MVACSDGQKNATSSHSEGIFLVGGFEGISAISVGDIGVLGLMAITFKEFTGLVMCQSRKVISCGLGAEISSFPFLHEV